MSRAWWPWAFVASTLACLWVRLRTNGILAAVGGGGCAVSLLFLWLTVTVRPDAGLEEVVADADPDDGFGGGDDG